jgi:uncharacterized membrane protein YfcA
MHFSLMILIAAIYVGLVKGGLGPVAGALIVPLLSTSMPVSDAVGLTLPMLVVGDWIALPVYWRQWDGPALRLMLPGALVGLAMGIALLTTLPDDTLRRVLGAFTLIVAAYKLASDALTTVQYTPRRWHGVLAGWGSGFGSALANVGAPPITAYLLLRKVTPTIFIGTTVCFFLIMNLIKLPIFLAADVIGVDQLVGVVWVLPLIPLGVWGGKRFIAWIDPKKFERLMLVLLVGVGLSLLR